MPRLTSQLIRHAAHIDRHLPLLLRECRDLESARNELRWMREAVQDAFSQKSTSRADLKRSELTRERHLVKFVKRRAKGEPLQYILGTQPFGDLDIKCMPGVLIPRYETETYTLEVARIVKDVTAFSKDPQQLSIVDFCTGSGCIALLLYATLKLPHQNSAPFKQLKVIGFDISQHALKLSHINLHHNLALGTLHKDAHKDVQFEHLNIFGLAQRTHESISTAFVLQTDVDPPHVIISNPPYISPTKYKPGGETTRSVRNFEPKLALVPPEIKHFNNVDQADQFYAALLKIALASRSKLLVMEVGDMEQALRVRSLCTANDDMYVEIWRDDGTILLESGHQSLEQASENAVEARVVVVWLDPIWIRWRKNNLGGSDQ